LLHAEMRQLDSLINLTTSQAASTFVVGHELCLVSAARLGLGTRNEHADDCPEIRRFIPADSIVEE
jgi:hypothetical protein